MASVPLIVGYVGGIGERSTKRAFAYSAVFAVGTAITFISLGIIATSAGRLIGNSSPIWYLVLGALMVLMALQTYGAMSMPALVVNEKVVAMGKVLKAADVEKLLHKLGF